MNSIVSYPERGQYGRNTYRGNCSGRLIEDIISQYHIKSLSDFMVGSGTTEEVCRTHGIAGDFADLNRGYDMMSMEIPNRADNIFWHPPYHDMVVYSGEQYSDNDVIRQYGFDPKDGDLSRCASWEEFVERMNYCMLKQFTALEKGGRMFVLMGDMKRKGRLYSMLTDIAKPGCLEQIIIKTQHNCWSDTQSYKVRNFVPIIHEYLMIVRKESNLIIPVSFSSTRNLDIRDSQNASWRDILFSILKENGGVMTLTELYFQMKDRKKTLANPHWQEKIRQTLQNKKYFVSPCRGHYSVAC